MKLTEENEEDIPEFPETFFVDYVKLTHFVAGVSGGVASTLILHPLDLLKIRFSVCDDRTPDRKHLGLKQTVQSIYRTEGWEGFFKGAYPNFFGCGLSWGFYFLFYSDLKSLMQGGDATKDIGPFKHMLAASTAGAVTLALTNPIWVTKTRLCLQQQQNKNPQLHYAGMRDCMAKICEEEGFRGLYKGFLPGLLGVSHGAIQFMIYEEFKSSSNVRQGRPINSQLDTKEYILYAAVSKVIASSLTFPYQVIRSRLQDQHRRYRGFKHCVKLTYDREGWKGFYKGLTPSLIRVVPSTIITFVAYENISSFLRSKWTSHENEA
ncbi:unnamed protein product [Bemisia tabaci]|uniref:Mitochondrial folate transporter/carrier n=1 Tax=Bemisia tabaci TaxID=7038 RepID=A0A9P0AG39_BEMTA|nr:unnamed protein product [Bemisia tabaci]